MSVRSFVRRVGNALWLILSVGILIGLVVGFFLAKHRYQVTPAPTTQVAIVSAPEKPKIEEVKEELPTPLLVRRGDTLSQIAVNLGGGVKLQHEIAKLSRLSDENWIVAGYYLLIPAYVKVPKEFLKTREEAEAIAKKEVAELDSYVEEAQLPQTATNVKSDTPEVLAENAIQLHEPASTVPASIENPKESTVARIEIHDYIGAKHQSVVITATVDEQGKLQTTTEKTTETSTPAETPSKSEDRVVPSPRATQAAYRVQVPHGTVQGMKSGKLAAYIVHTNAAGKLVHEETAVSVTDIDGGFEWTIPHTAELREGSALAFDTGGKDGKVVLIPGQIVQSKATTVWIEPTASKLNKKAYSRLSKNYAPKRSVGMAILKKAAPIGAGMLLRGPYMGLAMGGFSLIADSLRTRNVTTIQIESLAGKLDDIDRRLTELEKEKESK